MEKTRNINTMNICLKKTEIQSQSLAFGTYGDSGNGGNAGANLMVANDGCLPPRSPPLFYRGNQEETRFVNKNDVGAQPQGVFFTFGQWVPFHCSIACSSRLSALRTGFW